MNLLAAILVALVFTGCQTAPSQPYARDVKRMPNQGGVIALNNDHREEDRAKADMMMQKTCGSLPVKIKEEGEVAAKPDRKSDKEWQIVYDCGSSKTKKR